MAATLRVLWLFFFVNSHSAGRVGRSSIQVGSAHNAKFAARLLYSWQNDAHFLVMESNITQFTSSFFFLVFWWWILVYEPKHVALKPYNILKECSCDCRLFSSHLVYLCNNRMCCVKIFFGTYCTSCSGGYVFWCRHSASWQRERERLCAFFFHSSFKISIPLQACTGPEEF